MHTIDIRLWAPEDLPAIQEIWNGIIDQGNAFPADTPLTLSELTDMLEGQSAAAVAVQNQRVVGVSILHPNGVGRVSHIANASYGVHPAARGCGAGRALVLDSLRRAKAMGFHGLQFNAVVASNQAAISLYLSLGFTPIGVVPGGYRRKDGTLEDIHLFFYELN